MALAANAKLLERMSPAEFGYTPLAGETIYEGGLVALNAAGTLQRIQTAGAVAFAGIADGARASGDTRAVRCRKGTWKIAVAAATAANVGQPVYATADDTAVLGAVTAAAVMGASNTGNATVTAGPTASAACIPGTYVAVFTGATTFKMVGPGGISLDAGASLAAYSSGGLGFTFTAGLTPMAAGDYCVFTVAVASGGLQIGTLAGIEAGATFVKLA